MSSGSLVPVGENLSFCLARITHCVTSMKRGQAPDKFRKVKASPLITKLQAYDRQWMIFRVDLARVWRWL